MLVKIVQWRLLKRVLLLQLKELQQFNLKYSVWQDQNIALTNCFALETLEWISFVKIFDLIN
jgi:hypothetical protein